MSENEPVMYVIVNRELKMSPGKLAAQVAHSTCKASHRAETAERTTNEYVCWQEWWNGSYTKIILKASEFELKQIMEKYHVLCVFTRDEGRTEIPKGSLTTVAFMPMRRGDVPEELKGLKLL